MTFDDFKLWFSTLDSTLGGKPPTLHQWWELKARLEAVDRPTALAEPAAPEPEPLAPQDEAQAEDIEPPLVEPDDDNDKDGGLTRAVVRALREQQKDLRPAPRTREPA